MSIELGEARIMAVRNSETTASFVQLLADVKDLAGFLMSSLKEAKLVAIEVQMAQRQVEIRALKHPNPFCRKHTD